MSAEAYAATPADHPVTACLDGVTAAFLEVREVPVALMGTEQKAAALQALAQIESLAAAQRLRLLAASDDVALDLGARDVGAWYAHTTRTDPGPCRRDLRLAEALSLRWTGVEAALADARVNKAQAQVIAEALEALPVADLPPAVVADAEARLIGFAAEFNPQQLRVLGRKILEVVAPEIGEAQEARALEAEERRAEEKTLLRIQRVGDGCSRITGVVPDAVAHRLRTYLEAFTSPRHDAMVGGDGEGRSAERNRGQAFCSLLEAVDPQRLPLHGGDATTVVVTVPLEALRAELAAGDLLGADDRISASQARRLACTAKVIPAVLGTDSEVLDLGRGARLFSAAQRKALRIRDRRCRAEGCTVPAPWCEAHHRRPWSEGGTTDLADGVLLCGFHHHRAHDGRYLSTALPNGDVRFSRRT